VRRLRLFKVESKQENEERTDSKRVAYIAVGIRCNSTVQTVEDGQPSSTKKDIARSHEK
jgi:hypothetical protein